MQPSGTSRHPPTLEPAVRVHLRRWPWPGNVRELRNVAAYCAAMTPGGRVRMEDLPPALFQNRYRLTPMDGNQGMEVVTKPGGGLVEPATGRTSEVRSFVILMDAPPSAIRPALDQVVFAPRGTRAMR